jgi:hypothetical protein
MTSPALHRFREKTPERSGDDQRRWMSFIGVGTLTGGLILSLVAFFFQKYDLVFGLSLGAFFSYLNFNSLKALTDKVLKQPEKGQGYFWFWNLLRWVLFAFVCGFFIWVSPGCLLGAVVSYIWSLLVLGWAGYRWATRTKTS